MKIILHIGLCFPILLQVPSREKMIIMVLDICALLFCQMNTANPVAFSYQIKLQNIYFTE